MWAIGVVGLTAAFIATRLVSRASEDNDADVAENSDAQCFTFRMNERKYPPFRDDDIEGIHIEGDATQPDSQIVILGIEKREFEANGSQTDAHMAVARCDMHRLWRLAVSKEAVLPLLPDSNQEYYTAALYVSPGAMHLTLGFIVKEHFTPCQSAKILAVTTQEGLLYDYPSVPIIDIQ
jgi:hypothetical protein